MSSPAVSAGGDLTMQLRCSGLAKSFAGRTVLQPFLLEIAPGEIHALLGQNGSGKSTLIKILSGLYEPDFKRECLVGGQQLVFGDPVSSRDLGLRFVHQDLGLIGEASVLDNLSYTRGYLTRYGTIGHRANRARARTAMDLVGLDVDPDTLVSHLTAAQRTGVAVARALGSDSNLARVLVLDEPTATLPEVEVENLHRMLRTAAAGGVGILYVTHYLDEVFRLAKTVTVLRDGFLVASGPVAQTDRSTLVRALVGAELEAVQREVRADRHGPQAEAPILSVTDLGAGVIQGVSFDIKPGETVGFAGVTGSGRETVLGAIFGSLPRQRGVVRVGEVDLPAFSPSAAKDSGVAYVPPDRKISGAFLHLSAAENLSIADLRPFWRRWYLRMKEETAIVKSWFERLNVRPSDGYNREFATFSGGNQQKIIFGKWLRTSPRVLLLDEPTQGVDVGAKAEIHRQIISACEGGMAVVVSTTDTEELATLCDRILFMAGGRIVGEMAGGNFRDADINRRFHELSI